MTEMTKPDRMLELERMLVKVSQPAEERLAKADPSMKGLRPAAIEWMTEEEREAFHEIWLEYQSLLSRWNAGARDRILVRRALRRAKLRGEVCDDQLPGRVRCGDRPAASDGV